MWVNFLLITAVVQAIPIQETLTADNIQTNDKIEGNNLTTTEDTIVITIQPVKELEITMIQNRTHPTGRGLEPTMEMLDPKRYPKPKKPMGNDIGVARVLDTYVDASPIGIASPATAINRKESQAMKSAANKKNAPDHLEATISIGYTMAASDSNPKAGVEQPSDISRQMQQFMDSIPKMPKLFFPNLEFQKDPEEEAINQRITEVARQLAENTMRKENQVENKNVDNGSAKKSEDKTGKSFVNANSLPLVSHLPTETAQLQLIAEVQAIPQIMIREGFPPLTPPPELIGPLLGGPPLKEDNINKMRMGRS